MQVPIGALECDVKVEFLHVACASKLWVQSKGVGLGLGELQCRGEGLGGWRFRGEGLGIGVRDWG